MKQEVRMFWLGALRDPSKQQGSGCLRTEDGKQCCLDLLMEEAVRQGVQEPPELRTSNVMVTVPPRYVYPCDPSDPAYQADYNGAPDKLTAKVREWAGLKDNDPVIMPSGMNQDEDEQDDDFTGRASYLNDVGGLTFSEIAQAVELHDPQ